MTIGPDPMIRILWMSVRLGIPHQIEKLFEQVIGIVRPGRRFRMILNAEGGNGTVFEAFYRVVVQVDVRDVHVVQVETLRVDGETVVLCCDLNLLALEVQNRMIAAMMAELQLVGLPAQSQSHNLVTETDSKDRFLSQQFP